MPTVEIKGLTELARTLEQEIPEKLAKSVIRNALNAGVEVIEEAIESSAPVRSGELKESIVSRTQIENARGGLRGFAVVGPGYRVSGKKSGKSTDDPGVYALFVEKGHGPPGTAREKRLAKRRGVAIEFGDRATPPHPFMAPAFESVKAEALDAIVDSLRSGIEEAAKSAAKK